jgi:hypothetical protein
MERSSTGYMSNEERVAAVQRHKEVNVPKYDACRIRRFFSLSLAGAVLNGNCPSKYLSKPLRFSTYYYQVV